MQMMIDHGKQGKSGEIPTDMLVNLLSNTMNKPTSLKVDNKSWAKWVWEIIYTGMKVSFE